MTAAHLVFGQILWWWFIMGSVFMALEWEYGDNDSFLDHVSRNTIVEYGLRIGLLVNLGTVVGGFLVWPVVAFRRVPPRYQAAVSPARLVRRRARPAPDPAADSTVGIAVEGADAGGSGETAGGVENDEPADDTETAGKGDTTAGCTMTPESTVDATNDKGSS